MSEIKDKLILVVDDEPRMINFMRMNLELEGMRVISAPNGKEALEHVREELEAAGFHTRSHAAP